MKVSKAAELVEASERTVRRHIDSGKYKAISKTNARAKGGKLYLIPITSLPPKAQEMFWKEKQGDFLAVKKEAPPSPLGERICTVAELVAKYGEEKAKTILAKPRKCERIVLVALKIGECREKIKRQEALAKKHTISLGTLRRWITAYETNGLIGLVNDKYLEPGEGLDMKDRRTVTNEMRDFI